MGVQNGIKHPSPPAPLEPYWEPTVDREAKAISYIMLAATMNNFAVHDVPTAVERVRRSLSESDPRH